MLPEGFPVFERFQLEEPPAQDLGNVLLYNWLYGFLALALEDVVKLGLNFADGVCEI
jgi:hypothetical protein